MSFNALGTPLLFSLLIIASIHISIIARAQDTAPTTTDDGTAAFPPDIDTDSDGFLNRTEVLKALQSSYSRHRQSTSIVVDPFFWPRVRNTIFVDADTNVDGRLNVTEGNSRGVVAAITGEHLVEFAVLAGAASNSADGFLTLAELEKAYPNAGTILAANGSPEKINVIFFSEMIWITPPPPPIGTREPPADDRAPPVDPTAGANPPMPTLHTDDTTTLPQRPTDPPTDPPTPTLTEGARGGGSEGSDDSTPTASTSTSDDNNERADASPTSAGDETSDSNNKSAVIAGAVVGTLIFSCIVAFIIVGCIYWRGRQDKVEPVIASAYPNPMGNTAGAGGTMRMRLHSTGTYGY